MPYTFVCIQIMCTLTILKTYFCQNVSTRYSVLPYTSHVEAVVEFEKYDSKTVPSTLVIEFIRTQTRTYILFCDNTRVQMFYFLSNYQ